jgi:hypothetical protein
LQLLPFTSKMQDNLEITCFSLKQACFYPYDFDHNLFKWQNLKRGYNFLFVATHIQKDIKQTLLEVFSNVLLFFLKLNQPVDNMCFA